MAKKPDKAARAEIIDFEDAIKEAKAIIAASDQDQWRIAELAHLVQTGYGEKKLLTFAKAIGVAACSLERRRSVWRAWMEIPEPAPKSFPFALAMAMQNHPDRAKLLKEKPEMTRAEARSLKREQSGKTETKAAADKNNQRWFQEVIRLASAAVRASSIANGTVAPELRASLRAVVDPALLPSLREGGEALIRLADFLESVAQPAQETQLRPSEDQPFLAQAAE